MLTLNYEEILPFIFWKGILPIFSGIILQFILLFSNAARLHCASSSLALQGPTVAAAVWQAAGWALQLCPAHGVRGWERSHGAVLQMSVIQVEPQER